jgi:hypothetical protein
MDLADLQKAHAAIQEEALRLAGGLQDLPQRATTYHHLYRDSGGNHIFPLIAAHGALWARGYFRFGAWLGRGVALQYGFNQQRRQEQLRALAAFADGFRDINRRVCVDVYTNYHFVGRFGECPAADQLMPPAVFEALQRLHWARRLGRSLSDAERLGIYQAHFLKEQEHDVGPGIARAVAAFDWPAMKWLALQPIVRFAFFPRWRVLRFHNFANVQERIANGLKAFHWGVEVGWETVEQRLAAYRILPAAFFTEGAGYFERVREAVLAACQPA